MEINGRVFLSGGFFLLMVCFLIFPAMSFCETKEITAEGTYNMGDGETPMVAEKRAILQAKRIALEQAGTYVKSYSKMKDSNLTEDEIEVIASGIMEVDVMDRKRTIVGDGLNFWVKIRAKVQAEKMEEMAKSTKDRQAIDDYKRVQEAYDRSQKEIEDLKRQLAEARTENEKKQIQASIANDEKAFTANEWFEKGYKYSMVKDHERAIEAYTKAISIDQNHATVYNNRGLEYQNKGLYDRAIEDFNKALFIDPNYAVAYSNRGSVYSKKDSYDRAIEDFNKALLIDPNYAYAAYNYRGSAFGLKGQNDRAMEDFNKAISLSPNYADAYNNRGILYMVRLRNNKKACADWEKACELGDCKIYKQAKQDGDCK